MNCKPTSPVLLCIACAALPSVALCGGQTKSISIEDALATSKRVSSLLAANVQTRTTTNPVIAIVRTDVTWTEPTTTLISFIDCYGNASSVDKSGPVKIYIFKSKGIDISLCSQGRKVYSVMSPAEGYQFSFSMVDWLQKASAQETPNVRRLNGSDDTNPYCIPLMFGDFPRVVHGNRLTCLTAYPVREGKETVWDNGRTIWTVIADHDWTVHQTKPGRQLDLDTGSIKNIQQNDDRFYGNDITFMYGTLSKEHPVAIGICPCPMTIDYNTVLGRLPARETSSKDSFALPELVDPLIKRTISLSTSSSEVALPVITNAFYRKLKTVSYRIYADSVYKTPDGRNVQDNATSILKYYNIRPNIYGGEVDGPTAEMYASVLRDGKPASMNNQTPDLPIQWKTYSVALSWLPKWTAKHYPLKAVSDLVKWLNYSLFYGLMAPGSDSGQLGAGIWEQSRSGNSPIVLPAPWTDTFHKVGDVCSIETPELPYYNRGSYQNTDEFCKAMESQGASSDEFPGSLKIEGFVNCGGVECAWVSAVDIRGLHRADLYYNAKDGLLERAEGSFSGATSVHGIPVNAKVRRVIQRIAE